jgi:hypothetical protein
MPCLLNNLHNHLKTANQPFLMKQTPKNKK